MGRSPMSSDESGVKKGPWTPEEDDKLSKYIHKHGHGSWRALPRLAGLNRCGKSCRLRWTNYLRPDIKRGKFSQDEEQTILNLHAILGNKWSAIATHLPGRTDNEIKNFWNTHLKKKLIQMGFDPMTHRPRTDIFATIPHLLALANLIDHVNPASWELQYSQMPHCFNNLLHPPQTQFSSTIPNNNNINVNDLPFFNNLASIFPHLELPPPPSAHFMQDSMNFLHMPELQAPCSTAVDQTHLNDNKELVVVNNSQPSSSTSQWLHQTLQSPPPPAHETSITDVVDAGTTTSSYGGVAQMWSHLLDDSIFQDLP